MSSIDNAKAIVGFQRASARPACRNCVHGKEEIADRSPPYDTKTWMCKRGGFFVTAMAICKMHEPESAAARAAKQGGTNVQP